MALAFTLNFQFSWKAEFLSQPHGILQDKIRAYLLPEISLRIDLSGLKAKWHRFLSSKLA